MNNISKRVNKIEESGIRLVFKKAMELGPNAINLSIGQPHFPTPTDLKSTIKEAVEQNHNSYMPTMGYLPLRERIADKLISKNNIDANPDNTIITSGVSGGIFLLLSSIINKDDEIIVPDPYFVMYKELVQYFGAKFITHDTYPDFRLQPEKIEKLISDKTKAIIINSPNNPTGMVYSKKELEGLAKIAKKHNLLIISDEIYEDFDFDNKFFSIGSIYKNTITLNGFSKNLSITGWRVGYAHGPSDIIEAMNKLQMYSFVCASTPAQKAIAETDIESREIFDYSVNRDYLIQNLNKKYEIHIPEGAFYAYIKIPDYIDGFLDKCYKNRLLVVSGTVFSQKTGYFRLSFAVSGEILEKGVDVLNKLK